MTAKGSIYRGLRLLFSICIASLFLLLGVLAARGAGSRGSWSTTDFQVLNLSPYTQPITAHFLAPDGAVLYQIPDMVPPGGSAYYQPDPSHLSPGFTGTLYLESPGPVAMDIVHLDRLQDYDGNEVFPAVFDENLLNQAYTPVDRCIVLRIHNLNAAEAVIVDLDFFTSDGGVPAQTLERSIDPHGLVTVWPAMAIGPDFVGSAHLLANQPIEVTALSICGGLGAYVAPPDGDVRLFAPYVSPEVPGWVTTTIALQNTSSAPVIGQISYSSGLVVPFSLNPLGSAVFHSPFTSAAGSAVILANQPLVATVSVLDSSAQRGVFVYLAFAREESTHAVALPVLFSGYEGWETGDDIWVRNVGTMTAMVRIRFVGAWTGEVFWDEALVGPGETWQVTMPEIGAERAAAIVLADQPIIAMAGATMEYLAKNTVRDHYIRYRGTNFAFDCDLVSGADFAWSPSIPQPGQTVFMTATVPWGSEPISYTWDMGDGGVAEGPVVDHVYTQAGWHVVALTATNCLGFARESPEHSLFVRSEFGVAYLPLTLKAASP